MKKILKSILAITAISTAVLFTSCSKTTDPTTTTTVAAPTLTVNDGVTATSASLSVDTLKLKILASADTDRKIAKLTITRAITGQSTSTIKSSTYSQKDLIYTHNDVIAGAIVINEADVLTYVVTVEDDKGNVSSKTTTVTITSVATSGQILLGAPANTSNDYHFFGVSDGFRRYRAGATGADLAKDNSSKIDFIYFFSTSGSVMNALYSPDYAFTTGTGWATEVTSWATPLNKTMFKLTSLSSSQFDALVGSQFNTEMSLVDFTTGTQDKVALLGVGTVIAYKKNNGKRGFIKIGSTSASATGVLLVIVKSEL